MLLVEVDEVVARVGPSLILLPTGADVDASTPPRASPWEGAVEAEVRAVFANPVFAPNVCVVPPGADEVPKVRPAVGPAPNFRPPVVAPAVPPSAKPVDPLVVAPPRVNPLAGTVAGTPPSEKEVGALVLVVPPSFKPVPPLSAKPLDAPPSVSPLLGVAFAGAPPSENPVGALAAVAPSVNPGVPAAGAPPSENEVGAVVLATLPSNPG